MPAATPPEFQVELESFSGPFELLLGLLARKKLDITQLALAQVTGDFLAYMKLRPDLSQTTEFLVTAATLLALKTARLLPGDEQSDEDDQLFEARDLLFSRLLLYRVFAGATEQISRRLDSQSGFYPSAVPLEEQFQNLVPELKIALRPAEFAQLAADVFTAEKQEVVLVHMHEPTAPIERELKEVSKILRLKKSCSFSEIISGCSRPVIVSRFLSLLELYRHRQVNFIQQAPLSALIINWVGTDTDIKITDRYEGAENG
ncbi:MAG: ScpA family protein [Actinomycetaceae bacterium]|nr:ScpA family protein [Actinomycetaceae bacterium]